MSTDPVRGLLVLGGSVAGLGLAREARALGVEAVIADVARGPVARTRCARFLPLPSGREEAWLPALLRGRPPGRCAAIATGDRWVDLAARHREALRAEGVSLLHPDDETIAACLDKARFADWCEAHGVPTPRLHRGDPLEAPLPALLRPRRARHDHPEEGLPKAVEVRTPGELRAELGRFRAAGVEAVATESLLGEGLTQLSVPVACRGDEMLSFAAEKLRPPPDLARAGTLVRTCEAPDAEALARRTARLLRLSGIAEVEVLRSEGSGRCWVVEVNARPWAQYALARAAGHDFLPFVLFPERPAAPPRPRRAVTWIDLRADVAVCLLGPGALLRTGRIGWGEWLRSVAAARAFARFRPSDPLPAALDLLDAARVALRGRRPRGAREGSP